MSQITDPVPWKCVIINGWFLLKLHIIREDEEAFQTLIPLNQLKLLHPTLDNFQILLLLQVAHSETTHPNSLNKYNFDNILVKKIVFCYALLVMKKQNSLKKLVELFGKLIYWLIVKCPVNKYYKLINQ